jgi:dTDP-4-dehydrorhamnose reductase
MALDNVSINEVGNQNIKTKSILILGVDSKIGSNLIRYLKKNVSYRVIGTTRRKQKSKEIHSLYYLDLETLESNFSKENLDVIVICAGVTNQTICNDQPELTWKINVDNTIEAIKLLASPETHIIYLSSVSVFDGTKPFCNQLEIPNPINNYGKQKVAVELLLRKKYTNYAILRLTKVISKDTQFIRDWRDSADKGELIRAYANRYLSPVELGEVCKTISLIIGTRSFGLFQLGGDVEQSYFEFAKAYFQGEPKLSELVVAVDDPDDSRGIFNSLSSNLPVVDFDSPLS